MYKQTYFSIKSAVFVDSISLWHIILIRKRYCLLQKVFSLNRGKIIKGANIAYKIYHDKNIPEFGVIPNVLKNNQSYNVAYNIKWYDSVEEFKIENL